MTIERVQQLCLKLPGVTENIKLNDHLCFEVGGKTFLYLSPGEVPPTASFKVADEVFDELSDLPGFSPHKYLARYKWIRVDDIARLNTAAWEQYLSASHRLVAATLPARLRKELGY